MITLILILSISAIEVQNRILVPSPKARQLLYEPGCYVDLIDKVLAFNETYSPKNGVNCEQFRCDYDGYTYITSCTISFEGNCRKIPGNKTLPYPYCCDYLDCKKPTVNTKGTSSVDDTNNVPEKTPVTDAENKSNQEDSINTDDSNVPGEIKKELNTPIPSNNQSESVLQKKDQVNTQISVAGNPDNNNNNETQSQNLDEVEKNVTPPKANDESEKRENSSSEAVIKPKSNVRTETQNSNISSDTQKPIKTTSMEVKEKSLPLKQENKQAATEIGDVMNPESKDETETKNPKMTSDAQEQIKASNTEVEENLIPPNPQNDKSLDTSNGGTVDNDAKGIEEQPNAEKN